MNIIIGREPENISVEENIESEIIRAAELVGKLYGAENSELSVTLTDDDCHLLFVRVTNRKF